jgi:hypothetical protein
MAKIYSSYTYLTFIPNLNLNLQGSYLNLNLNLNPAFGTRLSLTENIRNDI